MNLYIINGNTGRILFNQYVSEVSFEDPINLIIDENGVFVTYYNVKVTFSIKINAIKLFRIWFMKFGLLRHIQIKWRILLPTCFLKILFNFSYYFYLLRLEKYYFKTHHSNLDNFNYNTNDLDIVFLQAKYAFLLGIKEVSTFKSKREITRKNLIIITPSNQVFIIANYHFFLFSKLDLFIGSGTIKYQKINQTEFT